MEKDKVEYDHGLSSGQPDSMDAQLFAELNQEYGDDQESEPQQESRVVKLLYRFFTFCFCLIFLFYILNSTYSFLTWPSLEFLGVSRELKQDEIVQQLQQGVVEIHRITSLTSRGEQRGTGFNISPKGFIITNRHVIEDAIAIRVSFPKGPTFHVYEYFFHPTRDLALIQLQQSDLPSVFLHTGKLPLIGDGVTIIGNPLGFPLVAMTGVISNYGHLPGETGLTMEIQAPIHQGSSGSPVFNEKGEVVGVVFATIPGDRSSKIRGLAIPIIYVQELLQQVDVL